METTLSQCCNNYIEKYTNTHVSNQEEHIYKRQQLGNVFDLIVQSVPVPLNPRPYKKPSMCPRQDPLGWEFITLFIPLLGTNFQPYFYNNYFAKSCKQICKHFYSNNSSSLSQYLSRSCFYLSLLFLFFYSPSVFTCVQNSLHLWIIKSDEKKEKIKNNCRG